MILIPKFCWDSILTHLSSAQLPPVSVTALSSIYFKLRLGKWLLGCLYPQQVSGLPEVSGQGLENGDPLTLFVPRRPALDTTRFQCFKLVRQSVSCQESVGKSCKAKKTMKAQETKIKQ